MIIKEKLLLQFADWQLQESPWACNSMEQSIAQHEVYSTIGQAILRITEMPEEDAPGWISVKDRMPDTIECTAGTRYSEALVVWTSGRKMLTAIFDGNEFITDCAFWDAEGEDVLYWMQPEPPKEDA